MKTTSLRTVLVCQAESHGSNGAFHSSWISFHRFHSNGLRLFSQLGQSFMCCLEQWRCSAVICHRARLTIRRLGIGDARPAVSPLVRPVHVRRYSVSCSKTNRTRPVLRNASAERTCNRSYGHSIHGPCGPTGLQSSTPLSRRYLASTEHLPRRTRQSTSRSAPKVPRVKFKPTCAKGRDVTNE